MINFKEWLEKQKKLDNSRKLTGGIRGYNLTKYSKFVRVFSGIQPGMFCFIAHPNIGKTTLITSLGLDLLASNKNVGVAMYTFDDRKEEIKNCWLSNCTEIDRNFVDTMNISDEDKKKRDITYNKFIDWAGSGRLVIRDLEDIPNMNALESDIDSLCFSNNMIILIDGISHLSNGISDRQRSNEEKSMGLKRICNKHNIPIILSTEVPKNAGHRPSMTDIADSRRYAYDSRAVICMSEVDDMHKETDVDGLAAMPKIMFDVTKNKFGGLKPVIFAYMDGCFSRFRITDENWWADARDYDKRQRRG